MIPLFLTETPPDATGQTVMTIVMFGAIIVFFYFFWIRPENKRKKKAQQMRNELIVGDEVTTIGGIVGRVVNIKDDAITIESGSDKSRIKIMRWAISSKGEQISDESK